MITSMDKARLLMLMVLSMMGIIKMENNMVKDYILGLMVISI